MIDWRSILTIPVPTQFTQNPQNYSSARYFEDIEDFEYQEVASATPIHALDVTVSNTAPADHNPSPPDLPASPLPPHCFVTYTDSQGRLRGGWDERATSTVKQCHGVGADGQVELINGSRIPLWAVRAVGQLNPEGRLIAAWTVRAHGYDGKEPAS